MHDAASHPSVFLVRGGNLQGTVHDILVEDGHIALCQPTGTYAPPKDMVIVEAEEQLVFPSFIDAHVHLREPGFEYKEDIASGLCAAAHGGFGDVMAMANTRPVNDAASVTRYMLEKAAHHWPHGPRLRPVGALTIGLEGKELAPLGELVDAGCVAFSNDGRPVANTEIFRRGMEYAAMWDKLVIDHCEDPYLAKDTHMNEGVVSGAIGVKGQPTVAEALHVARDILLAEYLNLPVHLAHISCRQSVELIAWARSRGVKVTAETCPHYLFLDETCLEQYSTAAKVCPPLRTQEDVMALRGAVRDGVISIFVTDHAPHAPHEKEHPLDSAPNGFIGLETAVPLTYGLVRQGILTLEDFVRMWHSAPAALFGLPANLFRKGDRADFFLFHPDEEWKVCRETIHSKSVNTPYWGQTMRGKVTTHFMGGHRVV